MGCFAETMTLTLPGKRGGNTSGGGIPAGLKVLLTSDDLCSMTSLHCDVNIDDVLTTLGDSDVT